MRAGSSSIDNQFQDTSSSVMWVKKRSRVDYGATASEVEHRSEVKVDDSRPLDSCTVDEAVEKIGFGVFQAIVMLFSGLIWTTEAFEILLLTILSTVLKCEWGLNEVEEALLTSVVFIGYFFGAIFWGFFVDFYGRKWGIFFVSVLCSCFGLMSAFSPDFGMMVFLRALLGFASAGGGQGITLCTEYLPAKSRGIGIMQMKIFWVAGGIGIVAIGWATVPTLGWRWLLVFAAIPVTVMTFFIPLMPSSPRYLIIKGKREQALRNINIVSRINCKPKLHIKLVTDQEKAEMNKQDSLSKKDLDDDHFNGGLPGAISQKSKIQQSRVMELFRNGMWKTTLILWVIWLNIVAYYYGIILLTTALFQYNSHCTSHSCSTDLDVCKTLEDDDYSTLLWTSAAEIPGVFLTMFLLVMPCMGRKVVVTTEMALLTIFTGLLLVCADRIVLTIILFACRALISGAFQAVYVYTPEVYSTTVRGLGLGLSSTFGRIGGVLVPYVALPLMRASDIAGILVFVGIAASSVVLVAILPIETKGRALKDTNK